MREEFAVRNAVPTAEGAIMIAMELSEGTINGSNCLVTGYGRIGKVLSEMLKGLGANVTVSARKPSDLSWIQLNGYQAVRTSQLADLTCKFDFVFNTIPSFILPEKYYPNITKIHSLLNWHLHREDLIKKQFLIRFKTDSGIIITGESSA